MSEDLYPISWFHETLTTILVKLPVQLIALKIMSWYLDTNGHQRNSNAGDLFNQLSSRSIAPSFSTKYVAHCFVIYLWTVFSSKYVQCYPAINCSPVFQTWISEQFSLQLWCTLPSHLSLWLLSSVCSLLLAEALLHKWYGIQRIFGQSLLQIVCFWSATQKLTSGVVECLKKFNLDIMNASFALVWYILDYIHQTYIHYIFIYKRE